MYTPKINRKKHPEDLAIDLCSRDNGHDSVPGDPKRRMGESGRGSYNLS